MKTGRPALAVALLFLGLVAVNYLASSLPLRFDATAEGIYTLSPGTRNILGRLEENVRLELYFSRSAAGLPVQVKNYAVRVQEMLRQYVRASRGRLELVVIDPKPDTPAEERATAAGLAAQPLRSGETIFFGLVATHADQQETIPFLSSEREQFLEYDLTQLIQRVEQLERPKLGLISGLPLRGQADMMALQMGRMPQSQLVLAEWERSFEIVNVEPAATELPAGLAALAVIHPQNLPEKLQFALDQFLLSGKPVFLALDPASRALSGRGGMMGVAQSGASSNLPKLLEAWGLEFKSDTVVGDPLSATPVQTPSGLVSRLPTWLSLLPQNLNRTSPATSQLQTLLFIEPGAIAPKPDAKHLTFTPLVETSDQAGTLPAFSVQFTQGDDVARRLTGASKQTLAALVQGKFKSAFPDGAPKDGAPPEAKPDDPAAASPAPAPAAAPLKESTGASTLLIVADTDWLLDDYSVRRLNFLGMQAYEPLNDNLALASNALEFLSGSPDLISIRGKGSSQRPFTVVRRMEAAAQQQYQERLAALETRLNDVQTKLSELQGRKTEGNRLVATPEVAKAIEDFQQQQAVMRAERRQIRAALREGIERLEYALAALNLILPVLIVCAFGLWFHHHRRQAA